MPLRKKAILVILIVIIATASACQGFSNPSVTPSPTISVTPGATSRPDVTPSPGTQPGEEAPDEEQGEDGEDPNNQQPHEEYTDMFSYYWNTPDIYGIQSINGKLKMGDYDFYGMGVNYYNLLLHAVKNGFSRDTVFYGL